MSAEPTFELDDDPTPGDPAAPLTPTVVLVRRDRGWAARFTWPALIVLAALAVLAYRVRTPDWRGLGLPDWAWSESGPPSNPAGFVPKPTAMPPLIVKVQGGSTPVGPEPTDPGDPPEQPAAGPRRVVALAPPPPGPIAGPFPDLDLATTTPEPSGAEPAPLALPGGHAPAGPEATKLALDEIRREAQRQRAERQDLEVVKVQIDRIDRERARQKKAERLALMLRNTAKQRDEFRDRLRKIIASQGRQGGSEIRRLCLDYQWDPAPKPKRLPAVMTGSGRRHRIEELRALGVAEPAILIQLAAIENRNRAARDGPRTFDEALARAAYYLMEVAPTPARDDL